MLKDINLLRSTVDLFSKSEKRKLQAFVVLQSLLGVLDLIGIAIIGLLGALAIAGVSDKPMTTPVRTIIEVFNLENSGFGTQLLVLGAIASLSLIVRTMCSIMIARKTSHFLSNKSAQISTLLAARYFALPISEIEKMQSQEAAFGINRGVESLVLRVLGGYVGVAADLILLILMISGLAFIDWIIAVSSLLFFGILGFTLHSFTGKRARRYGLALSNAEVESNRIIIETLLSYREIKVQDRLSSHIEMISKSRKLLAHSLGEMAFLPNLSKYIFESAIVLGAIVLGSVQYLTSDALGAATALSVFIVASTRIAPAVLRIQQSITQIRNNLGVATSTLELLTKTSKVKAINSKLMEPTIPNDEFTPSISMRKVSFKYESDKSPTINELNLEITAGTTVAIVGGTGSGKSTLLDLILGIREPSSGEIYISGVKPNIALKRWRGSVAYVPQDVRIFGGSIRENVTRGFENSEVSDSLILRALERAQLTASDGSRQDFLNLILEENGTNLSGGQRQRLGIARALCFDPTLLVLDEVTSSLDGETELAIIADLLTNKKRNMTVIIVAHRLHAIQAVDKIFLLGNGFLEDAGKYEELYYRNENFRKMAENMGLKGNSNN